MTTGKTLLKVLAPIAIILILAVGGLYVVKGRLGAPAGHDAGTPGAGAVALGSVLPDVTLHRFQGQDVRLSALPAKLALVNFWATWCEACMVEMPSIVKLRDAYKDKGFEVYGVNLDENPTAVLPKAIQKFSISFPVFTDSEGSLGELFDVHAIPLTVFIDKNRKVLLIENDGRDWNDPDFRATLEKWLAG